MTEWRPLKRFCAAPGEYGLNISSDQYVDQGVRLLRTSDISDDGKLRDDIAPVWVDPGVAGELILNPGDLLFSRSGTLGRAYVHEVGSPPTTFAAYLVRFVPTISVDCRYLTYCSQASFFKDQVTAGAVVSTIANFNAERYGELKIPWHREDHQRDIADFLVAETARIDTLIAKKLRMLEVLQERVAVQIKQLLRDWAAPMLPLKRSWSIIDCKHRTPTYVNDGFPVVSPGDASPGRLDLSRAHRFVELDDFLDLTSDGRRPARGDIIYSRNASIGIAAYVDTDQEFCMGQDVCLITSSSQSQLYLTFVLNTIAVDYFDMVKMGSTFSRINVSQIKDLAIPTPSQGEQSSLATVFDQLSKRTAELCSLLMRQIRLLRERRQAMITAAVTGESVS